MANRIPIGTIPLWEGNRRFYESSAKYWGKIRKTNVLPAKVDKRCRVDTNQFCGIISLLRHGRKVL